MKNFQKEFKNLQKESCNNKLQKNQNFIENREWDKIGKKKKRKKYTSMEEKNLIKRNGINNNNECVYNCWKILQKEFKNFLEWIIILYTSAYTIAEKFYKKNSKIYKKNRVIINCKRIKIL